DQIEAMTMADKIVVMHDGIVEQLGAPLELYDRPANTFVATFIGSPAMNMLDGSLGPDRASAVIEGGTRLPVACESGESGQPVKIGIRPEHLTIDGDGIPAEVVVVEPTGADTQVIARCAGGSISAIFRERHDFAPGQRIALAPMPGMVHVFDAATGKRL
ncbi:MAG TPA: TOBE domain-containing protein, partial [Burkholderiaceae bacterium]|nr:TOBE domain-containing protein [Burkholderiaceae bacterium]